MFGLTGQTQGFAPLGYCFSGHPFFLVSVTEPFVRPTVPGMQLQCFDEPVYGAVVIAEKEEESSLVQVQSWEKGIELGGALQLRDRLFVASEQGQTQTVVMRYVAKVRIQFHSTTKGTLSRWPVAIIV